MPVHPDPNPSEKGLEVLRMIISHVEIHGYQPSQQEMADALGVSKNAIQGRLKELARRNVVSLPDGNRERAVVLHYVRFKAYTSNLEKPSPDETGPTNYNPMLMFEEDRPEK